MRIGHAEMAVKRASEKTKSGKVFGHRRKKPEMFRVGLYARVSPQDQQTIPLQMRAMREYATTRGWTIVKQVKEVGSGASERQLRQMLMDAARWREIDVVLMWRLDRWGRSLPDLVSTLEELNHLGRIADPPLLLLVNLVLPCGAGMPRIERAAAPPYDARPAARTIGPDSIINRYRRPLSGGYGTLELTVCE
jgi:hypothetical protein